MKLLIVLALAVATVNADIWESLVKPGLPEGRIINGVDAAPGQAPFIVSLRTTSHFCGGSIIAPNWVLTAAHCLGNSNFNIVAGLHQRSDESNVQIRSVTRSNQFIHESYGGGVGPNDIGLIYVAEAFNLNVLARDGTAPVAQINLPSGRYSETGRGRLFGWGRDNSGALPNTLQTLEADIIGYNECKAALPASAPIAPVNICSYTTGTTDGACNGDSGGPLTIETPQGFEIVGIVSWGYTPCATTRLPSVYTMVSAYAPWIESTIANNS